MRCDACDESAIIDQPYASRHLCRSHFLEGVWERVRREFHRQLPRFLGGTVAVALSGGKDSSVALLLTVRYLARRPNARVVALSVDEGIAGYRSASLARARALTERLGVPHRIVRAEEEIGWSTDRMAARLAGAIPCGYCGVWRRQLLNRAARDAGANVLVLGFNLDDLAQTVLMNFARADLDRLLRMAPHRARQEGLVPRVAPLAAIPEREVYLYGAEVGLEFDHSECPYATRASRNVFREVLWRLEEEFPGTRQSLLRSRERVLEILATGGESGAPGRCAECGEPASGERCRACSFKALAVALPSGEAGA